MFASAAPTVRQNRRTLAVLIVVAIGLAVVPEVITHLNVKHVPDLPPLEDEAASSKFPLAHLASLAGSALLLFLSSVVADQNSEILRMQSLLSDLLPAQASNPTPAT